MEYVFLGCIMLFCFISLMKSLDTPKKKYYVEPKVSPLRKSTVRVVTISKYLLRGGDTSRFIKEVEEKMNIKIAKINNGEGMFFENFFGKIKVYSNGVEVCTIDNAAYSFGVSDYLEFSTDKDVLEWGESISTSEELKKRYLKIIDYIYVLCVKYPKMEKDGKVKSEINRLRNL